jgi:hypothetical protein
LGDRLKRWWKWLLIALWAAAMIGLPLTSFPPITRLTGATVAPFSAIPIGLLGLVWLAPYLVKGGKLPRETVPFLVFTLFVAALSAYAFFQVEGNFRDKPLFGQTVHSYIPLAIAAAFFLVASAWNADVHELKRSLRFIHLGGFLLLVWSVAQAVVIFRFNYHYPPFMDALKNALVTQSSMGGNPRLAGLTWEASWFAHQLNMLYLPLWLAATYQRTTVFPRIWKISVENIFLAVGLALFFLSSPRIGGLACLLMLLFLIFKFHVAIYHWILQRLARLREERRVSVLFRFGLALALAVLILAVYTGLGAGLLKIVSEHDWRVGLLVKSPLSKTELQRLTALDESALFLLGLRFAFLERTVYWMDGWRIFNDYPILGVGLGNAGYYFMSHLPAIGWSSIEVRAVAYINETLPNIKSIWYRLLAETGIAGFTLYVTWLLVLWSSASRSLRSRDAAVRTVALAGQLVLLAYIFEGFSVDTFGLPYLYTMAGLAAAAGVLYRGEAPDP